MRAELATLAQALIKALEAQKEVAPTVGIDELQAIDVKLGKVIASGRTGLRARRVRARTFTIDSIGRRPPADRSGSTRVEARNLTSYVFDPAGAAALPGGLGLIKASAAPAAAGRRHKPMPPNPFRSLDGFEEVDTDLFFGREREVSELHEMLAALHTPAAALRGMTRLLALLGPSGSSKSSLLRAGLVAELDRRPDRASRARAVVLSPGCGKARNKGSDSHSVQVIGHAAAMRRALSRSRFARPNIWRLMSLSRLILPST